MTYTEAEDALRKAGFTNIETNNISDLDISQSDREYKVGSMVINNSEEYTEDSRLPKTPEAVTMKKSPGSWNPTVLSISGMKSSKT